MEYLYIGSDDCKKASCNRKQEFPNGPSEYCLFCGLDEWGKQQTDYSGKVDQ